LVETPRELLMHAGHQAYGKRHARYLKGQLAEQRGDSRDLWRDDLVAFLLGCSLTFEHALVEAGVPLRNVERNTMISMFVPTLACAPAGRFHGPMVVTMRPIAAAQVDLVCTLSSRYPHAHGAPIHIGNPEAIGIIDLNWPEPRDSINQRLRDLA